MGIRYDDLWNKSRLFIEKSVKKRDEGDYGECQLWASVALELLGKATLSFIHPSLVVDPNTPKGFLIACEHIVNGDYKTITAKTVFDRLNTLISVDRFDSDTKAFCMRLANNRNSDLHSGALPFEGIILDSWLPKYWDTCKMLLEFQGNTLSDFIGPEEARIAEEIIVNRTVTLKRSIESRILKHKQEITERYDGSIPHGIKEEKLVLWDDDQEAIECPSCACQALITGELHDEGPIISDDDDPWIQYQDVTYEATFFWCRTCDLKLNNLEEIIAADIDHTFIKSLEIEPDYEPDYGND